MSAAASVPMMMRLPAWRARVAMALLLAGFAVRSPDFMVTPRFAQYAKRLQDSLLLASQGEDA